MKTPGKVIQVEKVWVGGKVYELKIRLVDNGRSYSKRFTYCVTHDVPPVEVHHDEANQCLKEAEAELRAALAVDWKPAIVIDADTGDNCRYVGTGGTLFQGRMSLRYSLVDVAKRPDGSDVWRERLDSGIVYGSSRKSHHEHDGTPSGVAVIPDTPENRAKLKVISDGLEKLGANLTLLLSQDRITKTLQDVRTLQLPASAPTAPTRRVTRKKS